MVGMGAVVTRSVPDFHLVVGRPAGSTACVCRCGRPLHRFATGSDPPALEVTCPACGLPYRLDGRAVTELAPPR
jgi:UDP-2-acetamido-3-amino-2,3-dideoxy-glucuronate N-acetyltransferase